MLDQHDARMLAAGSPRLRAAISLGDAQELTHGWYFPFLSATFAGCNGVIVNKDTGKLCHLGSAFPPERDLELYDRGYQFEVYDLVILEVHDHAKSVQTVQQLRAQVVEPVVEHGTVWKTPRDLTTSEISARLGDLPCTFEGLSIYFHLEVLEKARTARWLVFEAREHVPDRRPG